MSRHWWSAFPAGGEVASEVVGADPHQPADAMHRQEAAFDQAADLTVNRAGVPRRGEAVGMRSGRLAGRAGEKVD
ncbi:MAG: hypothetical protein ABW003_26305, partial [Microvirga sp.]